MLSLVLDLAILSLLLAVLGLGVLLRRRLADVRTDGAGLERLIEHLTAATARAEAALGELRRAASETGEQVGQDLARAQRMADDLRLLTDRADRLADGLVEGIRAARQVRNASPVPSAATPSAASVPVPRGRPASAADLEQALSTLR